MTWFRRFGTVHLPVHQSSLSDFSSQYGCPKRFSYKMQEQIAGGPSAREKANWKPTLGNAIHATIAAALTVAPDAICAGKLPSRERVLRRLGEELLRDAKGVPVEWYEASPEKELNDAATMVLGGLRTLGERARAIVAVESPFRVEIDGYVMEGTIDLLFEPREGEPGAIDLADWKSGERKIDPILRDHGYQVGTYALAMESGALWPGTERERRLERAPRSIWIVHLRDFIPYVRPPRKALAGQPRGPGWYRSNRRPDDVARLRVSLREAIGTVRMGRFPESLGEQCRRCDFRRRCLGEGHGPDAATVAHVESALEEIEGLDDLIPRVA